MICDHLLVLEADDNALAAIGEEGVVGAGAARETGEVVLPQDLLVGADQQHAVVAAIGDEHVVAAEGRGSPGISAGGSRDVSGGFRRRRNQHDLRAGVLRGENDACAAAATNDFGRFILAILLRPRWRPGRSGHRSEKLSAGCQTG